MGWKDMTKEQKKRFWAVVATGIIGTIIIRLVPTACRMLSLIINNILH